jgi:hypothetical protein
LYNPIIRDVGISDWAKFLFLTTGIKTKKPAIFNDAWLHPEPGEQAGWKDAIEKELNDMHFKQKIWGKMAIQNIKIQVIF